MVAAQPFVCGAIKFIPCGDLKGNRLCAHTHISVTLSVPWKRFKTTTCLLPPVLNELVCSFQALRSSSLSPPVRLSSAGLYSRSVSSSPSPRPASHTVSIRPSVGQTARIPRGHKPPTPWEAASRHPLGLVDEAFTFLDIQQSIACNLRYAAQSKLLPEPPAEWRVAYEPPSKHKKDRLSQSPLIFLSPSRSTASAPAGPVPYGSGSPFWHPQRSMTEANLGPLPADPRGLRLYTAKDSSTRRRWRRVKVKSNIDGKWVKSHYHGYQWTRKTEKLILHNEGPWKSEDDTRSWVYGDY